MGAQLVQGFVHGKAGIIRCQFEEYAPRFTEIQRVEIIPVDLGSDMQSLAEDLLPEFHLDLFIMYPESDVVIGSAAIVPPSTLRSFDQVNDGSRRDCVRYIT